MHTDYTIQTPEDGHESHEELVEEGAYQQSSYAQQSSN